MAAADAGSELDALMSLYPESVEVINKGGNKKDPEYGSENSDEMDSTFGTPTVFRVNVPLMFPSASSSVKIEAYMSAQNNDEDIEDAASSSLNGEESDKRPEFMRSQSGKKWHASFETLCLPPVTVTVVVSPKEKTSQMVLPEYTLSSPWLSMSQLSDLCSQLDKIHEENKSMPVIMLWVDWLENNSLEFLEIDDCVVLTDEEGSPNDSDYDVRGVPLAFSVQEKIYSILKYEAEEQRRKFLEEEHECEICFDVKKGDQFYQLSKCGHSFCVDCLKEYCETLVTEGTVQALNCLSKDCESVLPPSALRCVMKEDLYRRWETLTFQKALDTMQEITWCPRCDTPSFKEEDHETSHLARCAMCNFAFCTLCNEAYHRGSDCESLESRIKTLEENQPRNQSKEEQRRTLMLYKQELLNSITLKKISKPCPGCTAPIQRFAGCHKVTCSICGNSMCWVCGKQIKGYEHFNSGKCQLFGADEQVAPMFQMAQPEPNMRQIDMEIRLIGDPNLRRQLQRCPMCGQRNLREGNNNHVRCWACRNNFCYICKARIPGVVTAHFGPGKCPQHS